MASSSLPWHFMNEKFWEARKHTSYHLTDLEIDTLITDYFGVDYEICAAELLGSSEAWSHDTVNRLSELGQEEIDAFLTGKQYEYMTRNLLDKMCMDGKVPEGTILVEVYY